MFALLLDKLTQLRTSEQAAGICFHILWIHIHFEISPVYVMSEKDTNVQEKLDFEMRMREGAYKLLLACSKREQVLSASKNLLTCNARIKAYLAELQRTKQQQDMMGVSRCVVFSSDIQFHCTNTVVDLYDCFVAVNLIYVSTQMWSFKLWIYIFILGFQIQF